MKYQNKANEIGKVVEEKNKQYGDAINNTGEFLKLLYPDGIPVERYNDIGVLIRIYDKIKRVAAGHKEDSWEDIAGYGILMSSKED